MDMTAILYALLGVGAIALATIITCLLLATRKARKASREKWLKQHDELHNRIQRSKS